MPTKQFIRKIIQSILWQAKARRCQTDQENDQAEGDGPQKVIGRDRGTAEKHLDGSGSGENHESSSPDEQDVPAFLANRN
jgi:hypothetical protein